MKSISIIGSTGSIGVNALKIVEDFPERFRVSGLAARTNTELLAEQIKKFKPRVACLYEKSKLAELSERIKGADTRLVSGEEGLIEVVEEASSQLVLFSIVGASGLKPLLAAIRASKTIAFANKEPFVMAGDLIKRLAQEKGVELLPVDSEHSAIWQCLAAGERSDVDKIVLTSSGGPFLNKEAESFDRVTPEEALSHPRWKMGAKISVDSATLMNKALEVIEAHRLFDVPVDKIEVLIHPEAIVHSLVAFRDGSHIAQLAVTDMRIPIQYALTYPERIGTNGIPTLDLTALRSLTFLKPDLGKFPSLALGYEAARSGGTMPAVLNAANESAVSLFLERKVPFSQIPRLVGEVMSRHRPEFASGFEEILEADAWARGETLALARK